MASERARPRAPPFIDPPGYARHRPEETPLYQLGAALSRVRRCARSGWSSAAEIRVGGMRGASQVRPPRARISARALRGLSRRAARRVQLQAPRHLSLLRFPADDGQRRAPRGRGVTGEAYSMFIFAPSCSTGLISSAPSRRCFVELSLRVRRSCKRSLSGWPSASAAPSSAEASWLAMPTTAISSLTSPPDAGTREPLTRFIARLPRAVVFTEDPVPRLGRTGVPMRSADRSSSCAARCRRTLLHGSQRISCDAPPLCQARERLHECVERESQRGRNRTASLPQCLCGST